MKKVTMMIC